MSFGNPLLISLQGKTVTIIIHAVILRDYVLKVVESRKVNLLS